MNKISEKLEHLMVRNPLNGRLINILPLFELMNEGEFTSDGSVSNIVKSIQQVHDFMSTSIEMQKEHDFEHQFGNFKEVNYRLVRFRKAFESMEEFRP